MSTRPLPSPPSLKQYPPACAVNTSHYRGFRIDTVCCLDNWHVYVYGRGVDGAHVEGYATKKGALEAAKLGVDQALNPMTRLRRYLRGHMMRFTLTA
jgi:hypothetical protein